MKYLFFLFFIISSCSFLKIQGVEKISILQGITTTEEIEFSIVAHRSLDLDFELRDEISNRILPEKHQISSREYSPYQVHKILFSKSPNTIYNLFVFQKEKLIDQRLVGNGVEDSTKNKIILTSYTAEFSSKDREIWQRIFDEDPEMLLLMGNQIDFSNASADSEMSLWSQYIESRFQLPLYFQKKLIPTLTVWNDLDYGIKNGNESFQLKNESLSLFKIFWAQSLSSDSWSEGHGSGGSLGLGDFNFYALDNRSFRSHESSGSHLGTIQEEWLTKKLKDNPTPSFLIKGDQFFGGYHQGDSFEGEHPKNFIHFIDQLNQFQTPFILLSANTHHSEVMQFPRSLFKRPSFEVSTGPLHSKLSSIKEQDNPWLVVREQEKNNFLVIKNLIQSNHWFLEVESIDKYGKKLFRRELTVFIKDLQNNLNEARKRKSNRRRFRRTIKTNKRR